MVGEQFPANEWHLPVSCQHFHVRVLSSMMLRECECQVAHPLTGSLSLLQLVFACDLEQDNMQGRLSEDEINDVAAYVYDQASNDKW